FAFPETAQAILDNAPTGATNNIVDQILNRAQRIVRVRRVGADVPRDTLDGRVARAEVSLNDGDVAGAIAALDGLDGASAEVAAPWLAKARAHMAVRDAADKVEDLALVHLRAAGRN
ncbi:MAG: mitofilin family membrane protein, partial [Alphaproteobacteria bacterium]